MLATFELNFDGAITPETRWLRKAMLDVADWRMRQDQNDRRRGADERDARGRSEVHQRSP
jgi:hypothetical protein